MGVGGGHASVPNWIHQRGSRAPRPGAASGATQTAAAGLGRTGGHSEMTHARHMSEVIDNVLKAAAYID
jgi:hypothetical protein